MVAGPGVVTGLVPWLLTRWKVHRPGPGGVPARVLGVGMIAVGGAVLTRSFARFVIEGMGTPLPAAPTRHLVVGGMYRHVRNPMYVALEAVILGEALLLGQRRLLGDPRSQPYHPPCSYACMKSPNSPGALVRNMSSTGATCHDGCLAFARGSPMISGGSRSPSLEAARRLLSRATAGRLARPGPATYALRACSRALLAWSKPALPSRSRVAAAGGRWLLMAVRGISGARLSCVGQVPPGRGPGAPPLSPSD